MRKSRTYILRRISQVWATAGILATVIFVGWSLIAYRATPEARFALLSDPMVEVTHNDGVWSFMPTRSSDSMRVGMLFLPGSLVDPVAYAPLARAVAEAGFPAYILELPRRGAFGGADDPQLRVRATMLMRSSDIARRWVLTGHSRGAVIVSELASRAIEELAGVILIGTSHPRDVSLAALSVRVLKIIGTRDGLATMAEVMANQDKLPANTKWVEIEGGNHSQFGWYGFQPGDRRAIITPTEQREQMISSVLAMLRSCSSVDASTN